MKRYLYIALILSAFTAVSCQDKSDVGDIETGLTSVKISAGMSDETQSKVSLGDAADGITPLYWDADDSFDFNIQDEIYTFSVSEIKEDKRKADFVCGSAPATLPAGTYTATYPSGFTSVPAQQTGLKADIDKNYYMTADCDVHEGDTWEYISLNFQSQSAIVKMALRHIDFAGKTSGNVRREVYNIAINNDGAAVVSTTSTSEFTSDENGVVDVYFVIPAETAFSNTTITARCDGRDYIATINSDKTLQAGKLYNVVKDMTCTMPSVDTKAIDYDQVTHNSAFLEGKVTDEGLSNVVEKGFVWGTTYQPTIEAGNKIVLGEGPGDFTTTLTSLEPYTYYYFRAYAINSEGVSYGATRSFRTNDAIDYSNAIDLSSSGSANCYIIPSSGSYKLKAVKGNSTTSVGQCASASILWESYGTSTYISTNSLIGLVDCQNDYVYFKTHTTYNEGNAVIAVHDSAGKILWSWHLWLTNDQIQSHVHTNNAGTMMDRNLGALSATPSDRTLTFGLLYQWGRKDPFLSSSNSSDATSFKPTKCRSTNESNWKSEKCTESIGTIQYTIENPMTFITANSKNYDWYYTGTSTTDETRWGTTKTIYDPCPPGWKLPQAGTYKDDIGVWGYFPYGDEAFSWNNYGGMSVPETYAGSTAWYPAAGQIHSNTGALEYCGYSGQYWSCSKWVTSYASANFTCLSFSYYTKSDDDYASTSQAGVSASDGHSVRCAKDGNSSGGSGSAKSYTVNLNNQWRKSSSVSNPNSNIYDGVYESYSNYGKNNASALMYIDIVGYDTFTIYVRSNAESEYDYVTVYNLDSTSSAKMTTKSKQQSGTSISSYTPVTFSNIGGGSHRITVKYSKDVSGHSGTDRGYLIIPKNQ